MLKKATLKIHIILLAIVVLNYVFKRTLEISLLSQIELTLKLVVVVTGLFLFVWFLRPFKKINFYFSIYAVSTFVLLLCFIFRGILAGLIASILLFPIYPDQVEFNTGDITVYNNYQGFMSRCCSFKVTEKHLFIFEKNYGVFETDRPIDFEKSKIRKEDNVIKVTYSTQYFDEKTSEFMLKDTTITLGEK